MKPIRCRKNIRFIRGTMLFGLLTLAMPGAAQLLQNTATVRVGRFWTAITDNGYRGNVSYTSGFFPNDYNILGMRGQYEQANVGSGFQIGTLLFKNPYETNPLKQIDTVAIYGLVNDYLKNGKITKAMTNFVRYPYIAQTISNPTKKQTVTAPNFGTVDPSKFAGGTYDQIIEIENEYVFGITLGRKILGWGQNHNDNYVVFDYVFTNNSTQTYDSLYIQMTANLNNGEYSDGRNPSPAASEAFAPTRTWQHYHGARASDTLMTFYGGRVPGKLRVYYEYSADNPDQEGDQMGAPSISQRKLMGANMLFFTILHASKRAYDGAAVRDEDDFIQPRTTYMGNSKEFPSSTAGDPYGDKSFFTMRGGLHEFGLSKMSGNTFPETRHSVNNDELGLSRWYEFFGGSFENQMYASFGPYHMTPGSKIHIVYASGWAGLTPQKAKEIGEKWMKGSLENPPNMPNPNSGWLPPNFLFPTPDEADKRKDRWVSTVIDSVMLAAYRAKWNFDHRYRIPQAPPPPSTIVIYAYGDGTEIQWSAPDAELLPNFAGYRIMRKVSSADTTYYQSVYDSDRNDKGATHSYKDNTVLALGQYYYYIQTKASISPDDANADPTTRGKLLYSSRVLIPNTMWVNPPRLSQEDLSKVRIAPNPYNINDPLLRTYGYTDQRAINFYNLPVTCTIKIFTENGDLVQTIRHDSPVRAGSETWDMITSSRQVISSGVYLAVIEKPSGEKTMLKFVVVR